MLLLLHHFKVAFRNTTTLNSTMFLLIPEFDQILDQAAGYSKFQYVSINTGASIINQTTKFYYTFYL